MMGGQFNRWTKKSPIRSLAIPKGASLILEVPHVRKFVNNTNKMLSLKFENNVLTISEDFK